MSQEPDRSKRERFAEFLRRLASAPPAATSLEAFQQLASVLNEVEDELTSIPFNPDTWQTDGRMYPPQQDSIRVIDGHPNVKRFRSRSHNTFFGDNGAIEIRAVTGETVIFTKPGADARGVWEQ